MASAAEHPRRYSARQRDDEIVRCDNARNDEIDDNSNACAGSARRTRIR